MLDLILRLCLYLKLFNYRWISKPFLTWSLLFIAQMVFLTGVCVALDDAALDTLVGRWSFFGFIYRGAEMPPINPRLKIEFDFERESNRLLYWREDERGFCERTAIFHLENCAPSNQQSQMDSLPTDLEFELPFIECQMYQKVVEVHPENRSDCSSRDSDMRLGTESWSPVQIKLEEFRLWAPLGSEGLIFRFHPVPKDSEE